MDKIKSMPPNRILAFSSSRSGNSGYLEPTVPVIKKFITSSEINIAFIPFASTNTNYKEYASKVSEGLKDLSLNIHLVLPDKAKLTIEKSDVIMVGGGNTFKLIHDIYELKLLDLIRDKVNNGAAYIGWSAGSNILSPTIGTTNDMPVIEPKSFNALGLLLFQLNPHYFNQKTEGFNGETRDQRLEEFLEINPGISIVGLPEGTGLYIENNSVKYFGKETGILFQKIETNIIKNEINTGADLSFLL